MLVMHLSKVLRDLGDAFKLEDLECVVAQHRNDRGDHAYVRQSLDTMLWLARSNYHLAFPEDSELSGYWNSLGSNVRKALSSHKYGNVYQVVIKAVPANSSLNRLDLLAIRVEMPVYSGTTLIKRIAKKFIPENQRGKAKAIARMFGVKG